MRGSVGWIRFDEFLLALQSALDSARAGLEQRQVEPVRRLFHRPRIAALSLEFPCGFKEEKPFGCGGPARLVMKVGRKGRGRGGNRHLMRIVFEATDGKTGEVRLDGRPLMEITRQMEAAGGSATWANRSLFRKLLGLFPAPWRSWEFVMTEEQSGTARQIIQEGENERI